MSVTNLGYKLLNQTFRIYMLTIIALPAWYFNKIIISTDLSVAEVWVLYSLLSLMGIIIMYNDLGFKESMVYFLPKFLVEKKHDSVKSTLINMFVIQIVTWGLIAIVLFLTSSFLAQHYFDYPASQTVIQWMTIYLIVQCLNPDSIFLVFQDAFWHKLLATINIFGVMCFSICLHFYGYPTIKRFAFAYIMFGCLTLLIGSYVLWHKYLKKMWQTSSYHRNMQEFVDIIKYSMGVLVSNNLGVLIGSIDLLLIMWLLWPVDAWYYTNSIVLTTILPSLIAPLFAMILPLTSDLHARRLYSQIQYLNSILINHILVLAVVVAWFGIVFGPELAVWLLGEKFRYSWQIAQVWFVGMPIGIMVWIMFIMFAWTGVVMQRIKTLAIGLVINIWCIVWAIMLWRWVYGVVASVIICRLVVAYLSRKHIDHTIKPSIDRSLMIQNVIVWWGTALLLKYIFASYLIWLSRRMLLACVIGIGIIYILIISLINYSKIYSTYKFLYHLYQQNHNSDKLS